MGMETGQNSGLPVFDQEFLRPAQCPGWDGATQGQAARRVFRTKKARGQPTPACESAHQSSSTPIYGGLPPLFPGGSVRSGSKNRPKKCKPEPLLLRSRNRKDAASAPAIGALTPDASAGCFGAGGAPTARKRPPNAGTEEVASFPARQDADAAGRITGESDSPEVPLDLAVARVERKAPGGHGENKAEDSLSGAGRFRKALRPGRCPLDRERTAARCNSSGRGGRGRTLRERSA